jgi:DNA (cytosine-5)-methyltransferase 1
MIYGSVCSGIEAASVAFAPLGWKAAFFSEIEKFPCQVLAHHYPDVPNHGDMTKFKEWKDETIRLLCGGTPCQSFSIAGLRKGLDDERGNLMLTFGEMAARFRPAWFLWENVPGVLSSGGGRDFAAFLGLLSGRKISVPRGGWGKAGIIPGYKNAYGLAYRVFDAQYFGVAQRRRRVFVVGYIGDWRPAAAVLFERESLRGYPAPRRKTGEGVAPTLDARAGRSGENTFNTSGGLIGIDYEHYAHSLGDATGPLLKGSPSGGGHPLPAVMAQWPADIAPTLRSMGHDGSHANGGGQLAMAVSLRGREGGATAEMSGTVSTALRASQGGGDKAHVLAFAQNTRDEVRYINGDGSIAGALAAETGMKQQTYLNTSSAVRRLTPRECERLQGFPDDYTNIPSDKGKPAADGPRYKSLGNSWAVPNVRWIGHRIDMIDKILSQ